MSTPSPALSIREACPRGADQRSGAYGAAAGGGGGGGGGSLSKASSMMDFDVYSTLRAYGGLASHVSPINLLTRYIAIPLTGPIVV